MSNLDSSKLISLVRAHSSNLLKESRYMDAVAHYDKEFANNDHLVFIDNIPNAYMGFMQEDLDVMLRRLMIHKLEHPIFVIRKPINLVDNKSELAYSIHAIMEKGLYDQLINHF